MSDVSFHHFWRFPILLLLEHFFQDSETAQLIQIFCYVIHHLKLLDLT